MKRFKYTVYIWRAGSWGTAMEKPRFATLSEAADAVLSAWLRPDVGDIELVRGNSLGRQILKVNS